MEVIIGKFKILIIFHLLKFFFNILYIIFFLACRTPFAGEKAIFQIRESGINTGKAKIYKLDNSSLQSVKQFAIEIKKDYKEIHVLINNGKESK